MPTCAPAAGWTGRARRTPSSASSSSTPTSGSRPPTPADRPVIRAMDGLGVVVGETTGGDALVAVHVQPGARRTGIAGRHGDALKVRVQARAEAGRANDAVGRLLASTFGVAPSAVLLVWGATARAKRFRLVGVPAADARARLAELIGGDDA